MENSFQTQVDELLGYGKKLKVFIGVDKEGKEVVEEFHFCPVPLRLIPTLSAKLDEFLKAANKGSFNESSVKVAAEIIKLSIQKVHPDVSLERVLEVFTLGTLARGIKIVMDVNDFFTEMQALEQIATVNPPAQQLKK